MLAIATLQGQSGASDSQPVSMFSYLKNLPLAIQTRVLSFNVSLITFVYIQIHAL